MEANDKQCIMRITIEDIINSKFRKINGIFIHPDISLGSVLYKYIRKEHFMGMMQSDQLYVANRTSFADRRERHWKENIKMRN